MSRGTRAVVGGAALLLVLLGVLTLVGTSQSSGGQTRVLGVQYTAPTTTVAARATTTTTLPEIPAVPADVPTTPPAATDDGGSGSAPADAPAFAPTPAATTATAPVPAPTTTTTTAAPRHVVETSDNHVVFSYQSDGQGPSGSSGGGSADNPLAFLITAKQVGNVVHVGVTLKNQSGRQIVFPHGGLLVRFVYTAYGQDARVVEIADPTVTDLADGAGLELAKDFTPPQYGSYSAGADVELEYRS